MIDIGQRLSEAAPIIKNGNRRVVSSFLTCFQTNNLSVLNRHPNRAQSCVLLSDCIKRQLPQKNNCHVLCLSVRSCNIAVVQPMVWPQQDGGHVDLTPRPKSAFIPTRWCNGSCACKQPKIPATAHQSLLATSYKAECLHKAQWNTRQYFFLSDWSNFQLNSRTYTISATLWWPSLSFNRSLDHQAMTKVRHKHHSSMFQWVVETLALTSSPTRTYLNDVCVLIWF